MRAVCTYIDDLYEIVRMLYEQEDVRLVKQKDYIESPKKSGYRSMHIILEIPISLQGENQWVKIELQLRTAAMDYWASLDYQLRYKKGNEKALQIGEELKEYAGTIEEIDRRILEIRKQIEAI